MNRNPVVSTFRFCVVLLTVCSLGRFAPAAHAAAAETTKPYDYRIILRVAEITPAPPPTAEQTERLKNELARELQSDVLGEYVAGLQTRYGLSVNDAALKEALGSGVREQPEYEERVTLWCASSFKEAVEKARRSGRRASRSSRRSRRAESVSSVRWRRITRFC